MTPVQQDKREELIKFAKYLFKYIGESFFKDTQSEDIIVDEYLNQKQG